jgi:2-oxoisovalerate dehydrogenase E1 component
LSIELDRAKIVDTQFVQSLSQSHFPKPHSEISFQEAGLKPEEVLDLFDTQMISRHLDIQARILKDKGQGFYTIGSSGHEGNAAVALALKATDLAFLHYRSTALVLQRAKMAQIADPIYEQLLSLVASSEDPISGGRHKVLGSVALHIPPQTSTIASHLPKAVGAAVGISLAKGFKESAYFKYPRETTVLCSFGDGSFNHSTAQGALHAASWAREHGIPLSLIFLCEDNGISISVPTPKDWIFKNLQSRPHIHYLACDGRNVLDVYHKTRQAQQLAKHGEVVFLHMKTTRLLGHAGSDIEFHYRSLEEIQQAEADDPLLHTARILLESKHCTAEIILDRYEHWREVVQQKALQACQRPKLTTKEAVMASLIPPARGWPSSPKKDLSQRAWIDSTSPNKPKNLAQNINLALHDCLAQYPTAVVFGEDVGKKGGVYRVTAGLQAQFGKNRVFDTLLDEQTILGTAIGMAHLGFLAVPEIQFLAYTHNAEDQIRGEAATLSFFSNAQYSNPMVIRIAGLAYQKGFGGHFHNDNSIAFLRDIPGIIVVTPSRAADGARLLRAAFELAWVHQRVVVFLEPIALYMTKDLFSAGDNLALEPYPPVEETIPYLEVGVEGDGKDLAILSFGNGAFLSRQVIPELSKRGIKARLIDLRWLHPLPESQLQKALADVGHVLIVDECRKTGSLSESLITWMHEHMPQKPVKRVTAEDCFIPIGLSWETLLPSKESILQEACSWLEKRPKAKTD